MPTDLPAVDQPAHPLAQLTTYELRDYRNQLESAITFSDKQDPMPLIRAKLQGWLDDVIAEQESRARPADAR